HLEHLDERDASGGRRRHGDDLVAPIGAAQRLADGGLVRAQVFGGDDAAVRLHRADDQPRGVALVEVARILFDPCQHAGELRLHEDLAGFVEASVALVDAPAVRELLHPLDGALRAQALREVIVHFESAGGELARGLDEVGPFQPSEALVREREAGDGAGDADGFVADGREFRDDFALGIDVHVARGRERRPFAIIDRLGAAVRVADQHEAAAATAASTAFPPFFMTSAPTREAISELDATMACRARTGSGEAAKRGRAKNRIATIRFMRAVYRFRGYPLHLMKDKIALNAVRRSSRFRVPITRPVKIGLKEGTLVDVSSANAFVTHSGPLKVGAEVTMTFDYSGLRFTGKLKVGSCGVVGRQSQSGETLYASRLYFTELPEESQGIIEEILTAGGE